MPSIALITGSAQGLGKHLALMFAQQGITPVLHYRSSETAVQAALAEVRLLAPHAIAVRGDLGKDTEVENIFRRIDEQFGRLDILVNNVGNFQRKPILEVSLEEWRGIFENNLHSAFHCTQLAIPLMRRHHFGRIINLGFAGVGNWHAEPDITAYFAAKSALLLLTKSFAKALATENIAVHLVSPGVLETSVEKPVHEIPKGKLASLDDFAAAVRFLTSAESHYLTGTHIEVSGGWRL